MTANGKQPHFRTFWMLTLGIVGLALLSFWVDIPIAKSFRGHVIPGDLRKLVTLSEVFSHGSGIAAIIIVVWAVAFDRRRKLLRVACCAFVPGMLASLSKVFVARHRPRALAEFPEQVVSTFDGFLPGLYQHAWAPMFESDIQSMPSGHSAAAVGLAIGLTWLFPQGKWCFAAFAVLAMCQRLESGAHFPSDTLFGAAIACCIAGRYVTTGWECRFFSRFEDRNAIAAVTRELRRVA